MTSNNRTPVAAQIPEPDLSFNVGEVRVLLNHTRATNEHRASYEDLFEPSYHKGGKIKEKHAGDGWPDPDNIDMSKVPAGLWLVKDRGIYLMSNGNPALLVEEGKSNNQVVYATEANPETVEDYWQVSRDIMGGDDCVITLPASMFEKIDSMKDDDLLLMRVGKDEIEVWFEHKNTAPRMKG